MLELSEWNPDSALLYKWGYSWSEIKKFYIRKQKVYFDRKKADYDFIVQVATACMGGGGNSEGTVSMDNGDGLDEMTPEQEQDLRDMLGTDYDLIYGR